MQRPNSVCCPHDPAGSFWVSFWQAYGEACSDDCCPEGDVLLCWDFADAAQQPCKKLWDSHISLQGFKGNPVHVKTMPASALAAAGLKLPCCTWAEVVMLRVLTGDSVEGKITGHPMEHLQEIQVSDG